MSSSRRDPLRRSRIPSVCALVASGRYSGYVVLDGMGVRASDVLDVRDSPSGLSMLGPRLDRLITREAPSVVLVAALDRSNRSIDAILRRLAKRISRRVTVVVQSTRNVLALLRRTRRSLANVLATLFLPDAAPGPHPSLDRLRYERPRIVALLLALVAFADRFPFACAALLPSHADALAPITARVRASLHSRALAL